MSDSTGTSQNRRAVSGDDIVCLARSTLGTPFKHQGRQPGLGIDCAGLVLWIGHRLGLTRFDISNYPRLPLEDRLLRLAAEAGFAPRETMRPGDVLCFRLARHPQHLAISTGHGIIHSCQKRGCVVEHRLDSAWRRHLVGIFSYPGLA